MLDMSREISVRELHEDTSGIVASVREGDRVTVTVDGASVVDIVPHVAFGSPWVLSHEVHRIIHRSAADRGLLDVIADVRGPSQDAIWVAAGRRRPGVDVPPPDVA
jgi:antitoxin (DNA-binding transcriptional repressor) of toxin-antitoxin stability system